MGKKWLSGLLAAILLISGFCWPVVADGEPTVEDGMNSYDVVVYGGNASGMIAAIKVAQMGKSVVVVEPNPFRIGGLTTGGLGETDVGSSGAIGGMAMEFYRRVGAAYGKTSPVYKFEAKVALQVLQDWAAEYNVPIFLDERLDLADGVAMTDGKIIAITTESGKVFRGKMFLDCTYEGDLMAKAGVTYTTGREGNDVYGESANGITKASDMDGLPSGIDPYVVEGDPESGLLPRVNADAGGDAGTGDNRIQAYNFRWNLTNKAENRVAVEKPEGYNEADYELLLRAIEKGLKADKIFKTGSSNALPGGKVDANNNCGISTDYVGMNYDYPEADYATRDKIVKAHETYQRGLLWTLQNNPRVPQEMREFFSQWGLCADEFTENNNWSTQIYVRESRRMVSDFVMTQNVCKVGSTVYVGDSVGMGSYHMDSHHIQYIVKNGQVVPEGGFYNPTTPYSISYRSIVPRANECQNLLVPVCVSASHAAYGSIRMEPVFMVLGQSAATAACLAIEDGVAVQELNYNRLAAKLKEDDQVLYLGNTNEDAPLNAIVYPVEDLPTVTSPEGLNYGYYDTAFATPPSTKYNRVYTAKVGDYIEFEIDVAEAGTYTLSAQTNRHESRAKYKLYLPDKGEYFGGEFDQYGKFNGDAADRIPTDTFGEITLAEPGKLKLRFEVTGKNEKSSGYTLAFCNIMLSKPATTAVRFQSNGGSKVSALAVNEIGLLIAEPTAPTRAGYTLEGWYADELLTDKWDFAADTVSESMTLYAKWVPNAPATFRVTFRTNYGEGGSTVGTQHIAVGGFAKQPADPKRAGYFFKGWYTDDTFATVWDFAADAVTADTLLYAKWEAEQPTVTLGDLDGDGDITVADALSVLQSITGKVTLTAPEKAAAEVDGEEGITVADALAILQRITGKIIFFPAEN